MQGTATQRRKVATNGAGSSKGTEGAATSSVVPVATVKRRKWGTGPFDEHWLNVDCCGLFCACLTYFLHAYGCYVVCLILIPPWLSYTAADNVRRLTMWGQFHSIAFCAVAFLACLAHVRAMTTDPGAVPPDATPLPQEEEQQEEDPEKAEPKRRKHVRLCRRCNAFKPQRAHHCSVCKRCIIKMDHHCPWVNNCVGIGNHKYFLLFVFYTSLSCAYSISLMIFRAVACASHPAFGSRKAPRCLDEPTHLINIVFLIVEALLFGLFTCCMKVDQWDVVMSNMTHIDRLKGLDSKQQQRVPGVMEVFGFGRRNVKSNSNNVNSRFRPDWLSPFAGVCFPSTVRDDIFGYCRPCPPSRNASNDSDNMEMAPLNPNGNGRMVRSATEIV